MTDATAGCAASPPIATSSSVMLAFARERLEPFDDVEHVVGERVLATPRGDPAALGCVLAAPVLAGEHPAGQREERQQPDTVVLQRRHEIVLDVALQPVVLVLRADEPLEVTRARGPFRLGDLPPGEVGRTEVAHLARAHEIVQRGQGLLDRRELVRPVQLVEVDPVGAQPAQRRLDRADDVAPRPARAPVLAVVDRRGGASRCRTSSRGRRRRGARSSNSPRRSSDSP